MLRPDLCDYSNAYIVVKETITIGWPNNAKRNKAVAFRNNAPFINGIKIDNADELDVVMAMYNLLEYSKNYKKTTDSLWNYYRDEPTNPPFSNSECFKYKPSITGNTYNIAAGGENYNANKACKNETEVAIPLKYLSNFLKSLSVPLINCELELILTWSKNCVLADMTVRDAESDKPAIVSPTRLEFKITDTKLYVPVVSLSKENDIKLLKQSGFKRTIKWNKYRSQMTIQPQKTTWII